MTRFKIIWEYSCKKFALCDRIFHPSAAWPLKELQLAKFKTDGEVLSQVFKCLPIKIRKLRHGSVFVMNLPSSVQALELHFIWCFQWQHYMTGNTVQNLNISLTPPFNSPRFYWLLFDPEHHCLRVVQTWRQWIVWILNSNVDSKMPVSNLLRPIRREDCSCVHICESFSYL